MKKNFLLMLMFSASFYTMTFAQTAATPEIPRNYKPEPKELLPMPGELTDAAIFPVLGKYEYTDKEGNVATVTVTRDIENKGQIWVNGMPQGKFKADLKASPATYKVLAQKTLQNDVEDAVIETAPAEESNSDSKVTATTARYSGKSLKEGTLIFDSTSNQLYLNIGHKFDQENPAGVFPEMMTASDSSTTEMVENENTDVAATGKKAKKKKEPESKGTTYVLTKVAQDTVAEAAAAENTDNNQ